MNRTTEALTPKMARAVAAILESDTRIQAAKAAGCSERTLYRWQVLPVFMAELRRRRSQMLDATASVLTSGSAACARTLVEVATSGGPLDSVRVQAARAVIDLAGRFEEMGALSSRLTELEAAVAASQPTSKGPTPWR